MATLRADAEGKARHWQVGELRVTQVVESRGASPPSFLFTGLTTERVQSHAWLRPHFAHADGRLFASIHAFVVESEGLCILVDTCVGNDKKRSVPMWNELQGPFLGDLERAGFPPERIDIVLCTHMHVDHVGWNTVLRNGEWVPTFPDARYLFSRLEYEHWSGSPDAGDRQVMADSVRPVVEAGLADWVASDHAITRDVRLEPTPGHTPGHVSVRLRSAGAEAVITGDLMHHPIQCGDPTIAAAFDVDARVALETRLAFLREQADRDVLVLGTHFAAPAGGWIVSAGDAWQFAVSRAV